MSSEFKDHLPDASQKLNFTLRIRPSIRFLPSLFVPSKHCFAPSLSSDAASQKMKAKHTKIRATRSIAKIKSKIKK